MAKTKRRLNKFHYYGKSFLNSLIPNFVLRLFLPSKVRQFDSKYLDRIAYYNAISSGFTVSEPCETVGNFKKTAASVYFYDLSKLIRHYPLGLKFHFLPGDVTHVPDQPTIVKSRPINSNNQNSVLLKLNQVRHYYYEKDLYAFSDKKNMLVWRGADYQQQRVEFLERHYSSERCDIGSVGNKNSKFKKDFMSIQQQLAYKYIMSIEGNDVATNLKWIFKSNSLCIMRKPRFETWFMEGTLKPGVHYVQVKDDFSDLNEKLDWCEANEKKCLEIIHNANVFASQFDDKKQEEIISLLVLQKYFQLSDQLPVE